MAANCPNLRELTISEEHLEVRIAHYDITWGVRQLLQGRLKQGAGGRGTKRGESERKGEGGESGSACV